MSWNESGPAPLGREAVLGRAQADSVYQTALLLVQLGSRCKEGGVLPGKKFNPAACFIRSVVEVV